MRKRTFGRWATRLAGAAFALVVAVYAAAGSVTVTDYNWW
jgi:hypothetical protein